MFIYSRNLPTISSTIFFSVSSLFLFFIVEQETLDMCPAILFYTPCPFTLLSSSRLWTPLTISLPHLILMPQLIHWDVSFGYFIAQELCLITFNIVSFILPSPFHHIDLIKPCLLVKNH